MQLTRNDSEGSGRSGPAKTAAGVGRGRAAPVRDHQVVASLLHNPTARLIKEALIYRRGHAGRDRVIIDVPYRLRR